MKLKVLALTSALLLLAAEAHTVATRTLASNTMPLAPHPPRL